MSYRTKRGFLAVALMLTALNLCVRAQGTTPAAESRPLVAATASADSDRARDGLSGPVRRVRTEIVKLSTKNAKVSEGQRALLETASYDIKGNKSENAYYPVAGETLTGREVYKYDERGNISEMTLHGSDGSLISKETYTYEFDLVGNWVKMTASVAVIEGGKLSFEPTEVTYRTITYYLDENMARMVQPASTGTVAPSSTVTEAHATARTEPAGTGAAAAGSNKTGVSLNAQTAALPAANGFDKTNMISTANRGGEMPGGANNARSNSPVVKVDAGGEPPSSRPAPKPLTKPVSGGVLNGAAIDLPKPEYPEIAKRARALGMVTVEVVIDETGKVISARASSGPTLLRDTAVKAALRARFSPTKLSGQPVKIAGLLNYNFSID
ncbi:MAG TPA: energy transducer TonB [Pyrinomonadaceae bacterium]|jgi:TonB family protein